MLSRTSIFPITAAEMGAVRYSRSIIMEVSTSSMRVINAGGLAVKKFRATDIGVLPSQNTLIKNVSGDD